MEVGNLGSKITGTFYNNAELLGIAGGIFAFGSGFLDNLQNFSELGMPKLDVTIREFIDPAHGAGALNLQMIELYLGGWVLQEMGFGGRLGGALQKLAKGVVIGNAVQHVVHEARYNKQV